MLTYILLFVAVAVGTAWRTRRQADGRGRQAPHRSAAAGASAGAPPPDAARSPTSAPPPRTVDETVTAVLRRQVPVRFGEPPRSWLGGLPMMPNDVPWPTAPYPERHADGEVPLHFVAQVACADLPRELWGGLGPRDGWLLLFINGQAWDLGENPRTVRILHVPALGPERPPPAGTPPVRDEGYEGYDYRYYRSEADIPPTWRRWPVDVVSLPNEPVEELASVLYDGAPVGPHGDPIRPGAPPADAAEWPFTWRGALHVVDSVIRVLAEARSASAAAAAFERGLQRIESPGWVDATLAAIAAAAADLERRLAELPDGADAAGPGEAERAARMRAYVRDQLAALARSAAYLRDDAGAAIAPAALAAKLRASRERYAAWRASRRLVLDGLRARILAHPLDDPMSADEFRPTLDALAAETHEHWALVRGRGVDGSAPAPITTSLVALAARGFAAALSEVAADLYVASPERRALVPAPVLARCEPHWRALDENRPHRMGGMHDGVQSTPAAGPQSQVLLFQVATDYAVQWCWGDTGAVYVMIDVARLAAHDFSVVDAWLESH